MNYLKAKYENDYKYFLVLRELILNLFLKENFFKFVKFTFLHIYGLQCLQSYEVFVR